MTNVTDCCENISVTEATLSLECSPDTQDRWVAGDIRGMGF